MGKFTKENVRSIIMRELDDAFNGDRLLYDVYEVRQMFNTICTRIDKLEDEDNNSNSRR